MSGSESEWRGWEIRLEKQLGLYFRNLRQRRWEWMNFFALALGSHIVLGLKAMSWVVLFYGKLGARTLEKDMIEGLSKVSDGDACTCQVAQSCPSLCTPRGYIACQASLPMKILQAIIPEWVVMPSSRVSSQPRDRTWVSYVACTGRPVLYHERHLGSPRMVIGVKIWEVFSTESGSFLDEESERDWNVIQNILNWLTGRRVGLLKGWSTQRSNFCKENFVYRSLGSFWMLVEHNDWTEVNWWNLGEIYGLDHCGYLKSYDLMNVSRERW